MAAVEYDLHTHSTYSDGWDWREMAETAADLGLAGIGITDHCPVIADEFGRREWFDLSETYPERRQVFNEGGAEVEVRVFDAAEVNYEPRAEDAIATFLAQADFEYTIGSVHLTDTVDITDPDLANADEGMRREAVTRFIDWELQLIDSGLFDVLGHLDLPRRSPQFRDVVYEEDYRRIADALADADIVPELNAGRLNRSLNDVHPSETYLELFADRNIPFVIGTDSHAPDQLTERVGLLRKQLADLPVEIQPLPACLDA